MVLNIFNLFKKKNKKEEAVVYEEIQQSNNTSKEYDHRECFLCKKEIGIEKKRWANGKLFHKKCFKKAYSDFINGKLKA